MIKFKWSHERKNSSKLVTSHNDGNASFASGGKFLCRRKQTGKASQSPSAFIRWRTITFTQFSKLQHKSYNEPLETLNGCLLTPPNVLKILTPHPPLFKCPDLAALNCSSCSFFKLYFLMNHERGFIIFFTFEVKIHFYSEIKTNFIFEMKIESTFEFRPECIFDIKFTLFEIKKLLVLLKLILFFHFELILLYFKRMLDRPLTDVSTPFEVAATYSLLLILLYCFSSVIPTRTSVPLDMFLLYSPICGTVKDSR